MTKLADLFPELYDKNYLLHLAMGYHSYGDGDTQELSLSEKAFDPFMTGLLLAEYDNPA